MKDTRFRLICPALGGIILLVFMLCQCGGRVVEADTSIGNNDVHLTLIPGGASPTPTPTCLVGVLDTGGGWMRPAVSSKLPPSTLGPLAFPPRNALYAPR